MIHGIQSHSGWFRSSAEHLNKAGFTVIAPDRRGSGENKLARADTPSFERLIADIFEFINLAEKNFSDDIHMIGISWGGKLVLAIMKLLPEIIKSFTLIAPGVIPKIKISKKERLCILKDIMISPLHRHKIPLNDPSYFTENPERKEFIHKDPLKLTEASARFMYQSWRLDLFIKNIPHVIKSPVKLFLAGKDRIIDNCKTLEYYRSIRVRSAKKELAFYPNAHHTIEFEKDNTLFLRDLQKWISTCQEEEQQSVY